MYIDKLDEIVNKYNNAYHRPTKIKPVDVKGNAYIDSSKEVSDKDHESKVCDHVRISKHKKSFAKGSSPNWFEEVFVIKEVKNSVPWTFDINDLKGEEFIGTLEKKRITKKKLTEIMSHGKVMIIHSIARMIKVNAIFS